MSPGLANPVYGSSTELEEFEKAKSPEALALSAFEDFAREMIAPAARKIAKLYREGSKDLSEEGLLLLYLGSPATSSLSYQMAVHALEARSIIGPVLEAAYERTALTAGADPGLLMREADGFQKTLFGSSSRGLDAAAPILATAYPGTQDTGMLRDLYGLDSRSAAQGAKMEASAVSKGLLGRVAGWAGKKLLQRMVGLSEASTNRAYTDGKVREAQVTVTDFNYLEKWVVSGRPNTCRECLKLQGRTTLPGGGFVSFGTKPWVLARAETPTGVRPGWHSACACTTVMVDAVTGEIVAY